MYFLKRVEVVLAALVERDDVGRGLFFSGRRSFSISAILAVRGLNASAGGGPGRHGRLDLGGHVLDADQDVELQVLALDLLGAGSWRGSRRGGSSSRAWRASARSSAPTWWLVMTRPFGETNEPEPPELNRTEDSRTWSSHSSVGLEAVLFELRTGRVVEQPHALVGLDDGGDHEQTQHGGNGRQDENTVTHGAPLRGGITGGCESSADVASL